MEAVTPMAEDRRLNPDEPPPGWRENNVRLIHDPTGWWRVSHARFGADTVETYGPIFDKLDAAGFAAVIKHLDDADAATVFAMLVKADRAIASATA
jgi:hypothetical protein